MLKNTLKDEVNRKQQEHGVFEVKHINNFP